MIFELKKELNELKKLTLGMMGQDTEVHGQPRYVDDSTKLLPVNSGMDAIDYTHTDIKGKIYDDGLEFSDVENIESESLSLHKKEIELIIKSLDKYRGKMKLAAEELCISARTLYRKIKQFDL